MTQARILYVDDEDDIREVAALALELDPGLAVRTCESGTDALAAAADWQPDLILLDVMMPHMDGPTTLARLRDTPATAGIPVVFITARTQASEVEQFKALGALGVLAKPFDPMTLSATIRSYLP
ncbi:response regulator [Sphingomonas japonica]|uniref:CheY-like chemotaxis protein n=1 Tax=Sphingomonas japonica TaxID=511662 RepID=A0ABX0U0D1_9SPHN|nr:response regulator [Sphingomonas japonica]NIJ23166.1 CheY-like chemotaxis protein [Sphingomonas japonica]